MKGNHHFTKFGIDFQIIFYLSDMHDVRAFSSLGIPLLLMILSKSSHNFRNKKKIPRSNIQVS